MVFIGSAPTAGELARQAAEEAVREGKLVIHAPAEDVENPTTTAGMFMVVCIHTATYTSVHALHMQLHIQTHIIHHRR